jgi:release factor glutamine methyltransferase
MPLKNLAYHVGHPLLGLLRSNHFVIRRLFGVRIPREVAVQFDPTTVALARELLREITEEDTTALEMGIGTAALISLSLMKRTRLRIDGVDCSPSRVATAQAVAEYNGLPARFWQSDLFSSVPDDARYDLTFFNPPYVPTQWGRDLKLTARLHVDGDQMWDGGEDGTSVLRSFLRQAPRFLSPRGRIVFGVQNLFVSDELISRAITESGCRLLHRHRRRLVPACVYVVAPQEVKETAAVHA